MGHGAPGMIIRHGLWKPDIARVARELTAFQRSHDRVAITDLSPSRIHDIGAAFHLRQQRVVEQVLSLGMQRCVDRNNVTNLDHVFDARMKNDVELFLGCLGQALAIEVVQVDIEGLQATEDRKTDSTRRNCADMHAFDIVGAADAVRDIPAALYHPLIGRNVVGVPIPGSSSRHGRGPAQSRVREHLPRDPSVIPRAAMRHVAALPT